MLRQFLVSVFMISLCSFFGLQNSSTKRSKIDSGCARLLVVRKRPEIRYIAFAVGTDYCPPAELGQLVAVSLVRAPRNCFLPPVPHKGWSERGRCNVAYEVGFPSTNVRREIVGTKRFWLHIRQLPSARSRQHSHPQQPPVSCEDGLVVDTRMYLEAPDSYLVVRTSLAIDGKVSEGRGMTLES